MKVTEDLETWVSRVRIGDIIKSPDFENLIFRDIIDQDGFLGFYVNPRKHSESWDNIRTTMLETAGRIKRSFVGVGKADNYINLKHTIDHSKEFVVIYVRRDTDAIKEDFFDKGEEVYPLKVIAKMLAPDGEYDENGIEIFFRMQSTIAKHAVREVINTGFMQITYKRIF